MNVYDFDKTIYKGDSTTQFFFYCLRKKPALLRYAPMQLWGFSKYFLGITDKTTAKETFYRFLRGLKDVDSMVISFWDSHMHKIKCWYKDAYAESDVVISASPEFLLAPVCERLSIGALLASRVDKKTGRYAGENCHGKEKVARYRAVYADTPIEKFYSDSRSDTPLAELAGESFLVAGDVIRAW